MPNMLLIASLILGTVLVGLPHTTHATSDPTPDARFGSITHGMVPPYHGQNGLRQDMSGAAFHEGLIVTVDDGGSPSNYPFVHALRTLTETPPTRMPIAPDQKDLEGATWSHGHYVITTSMALLNTPAFPGLTRLTVNPATRRITASTRTPFRAKLLAGLRHRFGDAWFQRIDGKRPRSGGLNVEAITRAAPHTTETETLLLGLRSPLFGARFGDPKTDAGLSLAEGAAIVAVVHDPFARTPTLTFRTLDLNGAGIRGMEWIPALNGFVIISGPVIRGSAYNLWFWPHLNAPPEPLTLPGFHQLCRPESVIPFTENETHHLIILSEHSGAACADAPFSFLKATLLPVAGPTDNTP